MRARVPGFIRMNPEAPARRSVSFFSLTSTILASPADPIWLKSAMQRLFQVAEHRRGNQLGVHITLRQGACPVDDFDCGGRRVRFAVPTLCGSAARALMEQPCQGVERFGEARARLRSAGAQRECESVSVAVGKRGVEEPPRA